MGLNPRSQKMTFNASFWDRAAFPERRPRQDDAAARQEDAALPFGPRPPFVGGDEFLQSCAVNG
jgi:hypothetical protein